MTKPVLAVVLVVLLGCDIIGPDKFTRRPATLEHYGFPAQVTVPTAAQRNVAFNVEFTTYGGGCVERAQNELRIEGLDVRIESYQREKINATCTDDLRFESNVIPVTISVAGTARIRVFGRRMPGAEALALERSVTLSP